MPSFIARLARRRFPDADHAFRLGKLGASILTAAFVCMAALAVVKAELLFEHRVEGQRLPTGVLLTAALLLALGAALRITRGSAGRRADHAIHGLWWGLAHGVSREVEIATGFVASILAGVAVAANEAAANAIGGWVTIVAGLSPAAAATVTVALIAAIGTVLTDLARGGITRAIREGGASPSR